MVSTSLLSRRSHPLHRKERQREARLPGDRVRRRWINVRVSGSLSCCGRNSRSTQCLRRTLPCNPRYARQIGEKRDRRKRQCAWRICQGLHEQRGCRVVGPTCAKTRKNRQGEWAKSCGVSRRGRDRVTSVARLHAPEVPCALERSGGELGLSVPWQPIR